MDDKARRMIEFVGQRLLRRPASPIDEDTPLLSSGLVDSFALVDVLIELQKLSGRRIPTGRVSPEDMDTVRKMFETADRVGKP
jgi:acyl carrier protein